VANYPGWTLPLSGGPGIWAPVACGAGLAALGAVLALFLRRRKKAAGGGADMD
jgi:hypothetical protein